jgi:hypothetical protein
MVDSKALVCLTTALTILQQAQLALGDEFAVSDVINMSGFFTADRSMDFRIAGSLSTHQG